MRIRISALTDAGKERENNEDALLFCPDLQQQEWLDQGTDNYISLGELGSLLIVADGMGGANAGEVASALAIDTVKDYFQSQRVQAAISQEMTAEMLQRAVVMADEAINQHIMKNPETKGMGTTIVICWLLGQTAHIAWCGDSRCYVYNPISGLRRLTTDHSYVQELINKGELTEEEAFTHPESNLITRGLGDFQTYPTADIVTYDFEPNDIILVCSDGLCGYCPDTDIENVMKDHYTDVKDCCQGLMTLALDAGGCDNISLLLASIIGDDDEQPSKVKFAPIKKFFYNLKNS